VVDLLQKDSLDMDENDRELIKKTVDRMNNDRIIVTH